MYDPTHVLKNIRNNWVMKKTQALRFTDPYTAKAIEAEKTDCIEIHNK